MFDEQFIDEVATAVADKLKPVIQECSPTVKDEGNELMTLSEAAKFLNISKSYMYKLTMKRALPFSKPTGRVCYFTRGDLLQWARQNRVATAGEITQQANNYCHRKGGAL